MDLKFLTSGGYCSSNPEQLRNVVRAVDEILAAVSAEEKTEGQNAIQEDEEGDGKKIENPSREEVSVDKTPVPIELPSISRKFTCTLQYSNEAEYEKILLWADNSDSQGILKFARESSCDAEEIEAKQLQKLRELNAWRDRLFGREYHE